MLWAYIVGCVGYLFMGVSVGQLSWQVWDQSVEFLHSEMLTLEQRAYRYKIRPSLVMFLLFPITTVRGTFHDETLSPFLYTFFTYSGKEGLRPELRFFYVAFLALTWPIKVALNTVVLLLMVTIVCLCILVLAVYGILSLPIELIFKKEIFALKGYAIIKSAIQQSYMDEPLTPEAKTDATRKLRVANETFKQRLQEIEERRAMAAEQVAALDREAVALRQVMDERQGGVFRASDDIEMTDADKAKLAG